MLLTLRFCFSQNRRNKQDKRTGVDKRSATIDKALTTPRI